VESVELEGKIKIIKEAKNKLDGKLTMRKYKDNYKKYGWPYIGKLLNGIKWNELKSKALNENFPPYKNWEMKDAIKNYKKACKYYNEPWVSSKKYKKYHKKFGGPSFGFIITYYQWSTFKKMVSEDLNSREAELNKAKNRFCSICAEIEDCTIKLEECRYWEQRQKLNGEER
jgi:hypothetical protein